MANDNDIKKDFSTAYDQANDHWASFLTEAKKDLEFSMGKQWDADDKAYLKTQGREALVFRKNHRVIKLITGYERRNRLSIKVDPVEGSDEMTASQLSAVMLLIMNDKYNIISDAFEQGPLKTGLNLLSIYIDYSLDPLNGDIKIKRVPYNRALLDPAVFERDLSDCGYVLRREFLTKAACRSLLPANKRSALAELNPGGRDAKYPHMTLPKGIDGKDLYHYDEFWRRTYKEYTLLIDPLTGKQFEWMQPKKRLGELQRLIVSKGHPGMREVPATKKTVSLDVLIEGEVVHSGPEPTGIEDYPFVPIMGFWDPEYGDDSALRCQSVTRVGRDPQTEVNKRRSKLLDIFDSQISSGWIAKKEGVVTPGSLYQSGQAQVIWLDAATAVPIDNVVRQIQPPAIPPGMFQFTELMDRDATEIPGATAELLGSPENDNIEVAGILSKLRSNNALTVLQDLFDNLRFAKALLGGKVIKAVQVNYSPQKIQRMINEQPTPEFFKKDFGKYDAVPVEGLLTDTQRQMYFAQIFALKQAGAPIPWAAIIDAAPIEDKNTLKDMVAKEEAAMAEQAKEQGFMQKIQTALMHAKLQTDTASAKEKLSQAEENRTSAMLDRARTVKEMQGMSFEQIMKFLDFMKGVSDSQNLHDIKAIGAQ